MQPPTPSAAGQPAPQRKPAWLGWLFAGTAVAALMTVALALAGREVVFGSANVTFVDDGGVGAALARRAHQAGVADRISDDELRAILTALRAKAADGDPRAAQVVFELARLQRQAAPE